MFQVSHVTLRTLSAIVWYIGGTILVLKGGSLLFEAEALSPGRLWTWLAIPIGLLLGGLKAKFRFTKNCRRNLARIDALEQPKIWQFFTPVFFLLLALMISAGATLSRLSHGNYPALIGVGILDLSIASALLGSSIGFWTHRAARDRVTDLA